MSKDTYTITQKCHTNFI